MFAIFLSIFALTPTPIRSHFRTYPLSLPCSLPHPLLRPLLHQLPHILIHEHLRESDKRPIFLFRHCGKKTGKAFYAGGDSSGYVTLTFKSGAGVTKQGFLIEITYGEGRSYTEFQALLSISMECAYLAKYLHRRGYLWDKGNWSVASKLGEFEIWW